LAKARRRRPPKRYKRRSKESLSLGRFTWGYPVLATADTKVFVDWIISRHNGPFVRHVHFTADSRHSSMQMGCPLCAKSGRS
jgi:hypothetical protein